MDMFDEFTMVSAPAGARESFADIHAMLGKLAETAGAPATVSAAAAPELTPAALPAVSAPASTVLGHQPNMFQRIKSVLLGTVDPVEHMKTMTPEARQQLLGKAMQNPEMQKDLWKYMASDNGQKMWGGMMSSPEGQKQSQAVLAKMLKSKDTQKALWAFVQTPAGRKAVTGMFTSETGRKQAWQAFTGAARGLADRAGGWMVKNPGWTALLAAVPAMFLLRTFMGSSRRPRYAPMARQSMPAWQSSPVQRFY